MTRRAGRHEPDIACTLCEGVDSSEPTSDGEQRGVPGAGHRDGVGIDCAAPGRSVADAGVLVRGDRIEKVGPRAAVEPSLTGPAVKTVDLEGGFLLPGLWDSHIHLGAAVPPHDVL